MCYVVIFGRMGLFLIIPFVLLKKTIVPQERRLALSMTGFGRVMFVLKGSRYPVA